MIWDRQCIQRFFSSLHTWFFEQAKRASVEGFFRVWCFSALLLLSLRDWVGDEIVNDDAGTNEGYELGGVAVGILMA